MTPFFFPMQLKSLLRKFSVISGLMNDLVDHGGRDTEFKNRWKGDNTMIKFQLGK